VNRVYHRHLRSTLIASVSTQQTAPLGLNCPSQIPIRMRRPQGCDRRQGMENISHRTEPDDEHT
jgi:hypothetical protein